jgi:hypothetical protein
MLQIYAQYPPESWDDGTIMEVKILITSDPYLPKRFAAVAWEWVMLMDTFDAAAVTCFAQARMNHGPEHIP